MSKRALLIGINRYRIPGADLRGCVNDVTNLTAALVEVLGFAKSDISTLLDAQATKRAIGAGIQRLVRTSKPGDVGWLHFSGHGSNFPDKEGDEADYREEALCPTDLDWRDPLTVTSLGHALDAVARRVELVVTLDCCFSGSNTRALQAPDAPVIARYLPSPWDLVAAESGRALRGERNSLGTSRTRSKVVRDTDLRWIVMQASLETEIAADALLGGVYEGVFTSALVWAIRHRPASSYVELLAATAKRLKALKFDQTPVLIGPGQRLKRPFLESSDAV